MLFVMVIENRKPLFSNRKITFSYFTCEQDYRLRDFSVEKTNKTKNKTKPKINFEVLWSRSTYFYHLVTQHLIFLARRFDIFSKMKALNPPYTSIIQVIVQKLYVFG